jgi:preprotein translocase subunit SecA
MTLTYLCRMELGENEINNMKREHDERDAALNSADGAGGAADSKRNSPCPCGSGLKYKHCCGKLK